MPGREGARVRLFSLIIFISIIAAFLLAAGCGDDESGTGTGTGTGTGQVVGTLQRPAEGEVAIIDDLGDLSTPEGDRINAPQWIDISQVSIKREGALIRFEMQVSEQLPASKPDDILGVEWGFLLNTDDDDSPNWGIYCGFPKTEWSCGLYDMESKERLADAAFPGTVTHEGTTLTWTVDPASFGSDGSFRWVAYVDAARPVGGTSQSVDRAADRVPNNGWPLGGWLVYP